MVIRDYDSSSQAVRISSLPRNYEFTETQTERGGPHGSGSFPKHNQNELFRKTYGSNAGDTSHDNGHGTE